MDFMDFRFLLIGLVAVFSISSCIPNKDLVYLQQKEAVKDSVQFAREVQKPYRVQVNDILNIRVKVLDQDNIQIFNPIGEQNFIANSEERAYFDGFTIDLHGNIRIPILGDLNVLGYTIEEIQGRIEELLLKEQFKETANIFVTVKLSGLRYTATGEVFTPGTKILFQERVNIIEALANVGDITIVGNRKDVQIIRQYPQGQQIHHLDLTDINIMNSPFYYIQPNDLIYVKPLKQKSWGTGTTGVQTFTTIATALTLIVTTVLLIDRL
jgi:polysaccharide export outer membrane protein